MLIIEVGVFALDEDNGFVEQIGDLLIVLCDCCLLFGLWLLFAVDRSACGVALDEDRLPALFTLLLLWPMLPKSCCWIVFSIAASGSSELPAAVCELPDDA